MEAGGGLEDKDQEEQTPLNHAAQATNPYYSFLRRITKDLGVFFGHAMLFVQFIFYQKENLFPI